MIFRPVETKKGVAQIKEFAQKNKLCYKTAQILTQRGIDTNEKLRKFLNPDLSDLRDCFLLDGIRQCRDRLQLAIDKNQSILLYGDYDVDGISAVALLHKFLKDKVTNLNCFLPNRYQDGYGLTLQTAQKIIETYNPDLIITVDCGITCVQEVEYIKSKNIDIIITDHHEPAEELPNTIVVDPKIGGQNYGFNGLCGAGVALKVIQAFVGINGLLDYLPIAALATVSDIVPLVDENRAIVKLGLENQSNLPSGIKKLTKNLKLTTINSQSISYKIAPRLNAGGRMGNAYTALNLFISDDRETITNSLNTLLEQNAQRQMLSQQIYNDCILEIKNKQLYQNKAIILKSENWDGGLLGIACARLVDDFCKPVFLFSEVDGELKGSVRSFGGINIHSLLTACSANLDTFGGHTMAAGLALKVDNYDLFISEVYNYLEKNTTDLDYLPIKYYDVQIKEEDITLQFAKELELLEPFGCENPLPQFLLSYQNCRVAPLANFENHLSLTVNNTLKFIHFNASELYDDYAFTQTKQSIFELQINEFRGKEYVKGLVKYSNFYGMDKKFEQISNGRMLKQLANEVQCSAHINFVKSNDVELLLANLLKKSGTAIVIYSQTTYQKFKNFLMEYNLPSFVGDSQSKFAENCIIFGLENLKSLDNYKNIVFLDGLYSRSYVKSFNGNIYATNDAPYKLEKLNVERNYFGQIFKSIKNILAKKSEFSNELQLFKLVKDNLPNLKNMSYVQFIFSLYVFIEIGVLELQADSYQIKLNEKVKTSLEISPLYNKIKLLQNFN